MSAQGSPTRIQQMARGSPWAHHTTIHGVSGLQRIWTWDIQLLHMVNHISYEGHTNGVSKSLTLLPREVTSGQPNLQNVCSKGRTLCLLSDSRRRTPPHLKLCSHPLHCVVRATGGSFGLPHRTPSAGLEEVHLGPGSRAAAAVPHSVCPPSPAFTRPRVCCWVGISGGVSLNLQTGIVPTGRQTRIPGPSLRRCFVWIIKTFPPCVP